MAGTLLQPKQIEGSYHLGGQVTIVFNATVVKLEAPSNNGERRHYLACSECGRVASVPLDKTTFVCDKCWEQYEEYRSWPATTA